MGSRGAWIVSLVLALSLSACDGGSADRGVDLQLDDLQLDPATGLPIVPVSIFDELWWWVDEPVDQLDPTLRYASEPAAAAAGPETSWVTLLAAFPDHDDALATAQELATAVAEPATETAWLSTAGVDAGMGFEWLGAAGPGTPFVQVIDRWLLLDGLRWREEHEGWARAELDDDSRYVSPLAQSLRARGAEVLVEGDRSGEGAIAFDFSCAGEDARLLTLGQELADHRLLSRMRAPWLAPPLTDDEQRARRTLRLAQTQWSIAFFQALNADKVYERLARDLDSAAVRGDDEAILEAIAALQAHMAMLVPDELPDLGPLEEALDAAVAADALESYGESALRDPSATPEPYVPATAEERLREATPFGADAGANWWRSGSAVYGVHSDEGRLALNAGVWSGIAGGLGPFVDHLSEGGCDDLRISLVDYDDVRGD